MLTVVYFSKEFPGLTTTFVYREVRALRELGVRVYAISAWRPPVEALSDEARAFVPETFYLLPVRWGQLALTHLRYLFSRPGRYLTTVARLTFFNRESTSNRLRALLHFVYGLPAAAEVERCQADHLHADFADGPATLAWIAARLTGKPFSFTAHANDLFAHPSLLREKLAAAQFAVPISNFNRRHLLALTDARSGEKLPVIHCGLELEQFPFAARPPRVGRPLVVGVGRLIEKKGFRYLIEACRLLVTNGFELECQIAGGGPLHAQLQAQIEQAGLRDRVSLRGAMPQEQVRALVQQADVFVLPCVPAADGDQDGIPVALMEAMALGVPVLSTTLSGIPELIEDGVSGRLTPPRDAAALASALRQTLEQPEQARAQAGAARAVIERDFDIRANAARLLARIHAAHSDSIPGNP